MASSSIRKYQDSCCSNNSKSTVKEPQVSEYKTAVIKKS